MTSVSRRAAPPRLFVVIVFFCFALIPSFGHDFDLDDYLWPTDPGFGVGNFTKLVAGQFTGEARDHAILLKGTTPCLMFEPGSFQMSIPMNLTVNDLATWSGQSRNEVIWQDAVVTIGPTGLQYWGFRTNLSLVGGTIDNSPDYLNGHRVVVAPVDPDSLDDIVVLSSDQRTILVKIQDANAEFQDSGFGFSLNRTIYEMAVVSTSANRDGRALALLTDYGLEYVCFGTGAVLASYYSPSPQQCSMAVIQGESPSGDDEVLFCTPDENGLSRLYRTDTSVSVFMDSIDEDIVSLSIGRLNQGPYMDAVALTGSTSDAIFLYSFEDQGGNRVFSFDESRSVRVGLSSQPFTGPRYPNALVHDFTHNGEQDFLCPVASQERVRIIQGRLSRPWADWDTSEESLFGGGLYGFSLLVRDVSTITPVPHQLNVQVILPGMVEFRPFPDYYLEKAVLVKRHENEELETEIPHHEVIPLSQVPLIWDENLGYLGNPTVPIGDLEEECHFAYFRIIRKIGQYIVDAGPPIIAALCKSNSGSIPTRQELFGNYRYTNWNAWDNVSPTTGGTRVNGILRVRRTWRSPPNSGFNP